MSVKQLRFNLEVIRALKLQADLIGKLYIELAKRDPEFTAAADQLPENIERSLEKLAQSMEALVSEYEQRRGP